MKAFFCAGVMFGCYLGGGVGDDGARALTYVDDGAVESGQGCSGFTISEVIY